MSKLFLLRKDETESKVANNRLFSYAVGLAGQNMAYNFISQRLFVFLNTVLKIPAERTGIITGVSTMWDALNDPLVGSLMDYRRHKPGNKMRPFVLWTAPIIGIIIAAMFGNYGMNESQTIIFAMVMYLLFDSFYSFQDVAIWGISAMSSPEAKERQRVIQWISIGAGAGSTFGGLFPMIKDILMGANVMNERNAYLSGAIFFGLGGMLISMLAYRMHEKVDSNPEKKAGVFSSILQLRHNKTLIIICLARIVQSFSLTLPWEYFFETEGISYTVMGAEISGGTAQVVYGYIMGIPGAVLMFLAVPIINRLGGNKRLLVFAELANIAARLIAFALGANDRFLKLGNIFAVMLVLGAAQVLCNMKDIAMRSLLTNSVDEVELKTGERTEGITFSMQNFVSKLTGAIPKFIQGFMLSFMGFNEKLPHADNVSVIRVQTSKLFLKYRWHQFILGPVIGAVLYLIVISFLKDDAAHTAQVEQELQLRRKAAEGFSREEI